MKAELPSVASNYASFTAGDCRVVGEMPVQTVGSSGPAFDSCAIVVVFTILRGKLYTGTGFVIGGGRVATVFHNTAEMSPTGAHYRLEVPLVISPYWGDVFEARVVGYDSCRDIAVLDVDWPHHPSFTLSSQLTHGEGERVFACSFAERRDGKDAQEFEGKATSKLNCEELETTKAPDGLKVNRSESGLWLSHSHNLAHGWSGCPVLLPDGTVVGMVNTLEVVRDSRKGADALPSVHPVAIKASDIVAVASKIEQTPLCNSGHASAVSAGTPRPELFGKLIEAIQALGRNDNEAAESAIRSFLESRPDSVAGHLMLGYAHRVTSRPDGAEKFFRQALELAPASKASTILIGDLLVSTGRADEGVEYMKKAREIDPGCMLAAGRLLNALIRAHRYDEASEVAESLGGRPLRDAVMAYDIAYLAFRQGDFDEAARMAAKGLELSPEFTRCRALLADALAESGKAADAERHYLELTKIEEDNPAAWYRYARFLIDHMPGKTLAARRASEKAESLNASEPEDSLEAVPPEVMDKLKQDLQQLPHPTLLERTRFRIENVWRDLTAGR